MSVWAAAALAVALALLSWTVGWLTTGGAIAALFVGGAVLVGAAVPGVVLLLLFFVSGSWLTYRTGRSTRSGRTGWQVLANGGWAAGGALAALLGWTWGWALLAGSLAAAQADTWATEIGRGARRPPRLITSITSARRVPPGTSGGVTPRGTSGGLLGAALMGGTAVAVGFRPAVAIGATLGGTVGMVVDSVLGATVQAVYRCDVCGRELETRRHPCGGTLHRIRGIDWIRNDAVNFLAAGVGGMVAMALGG